MTRRKLYVTVYFMLSAASLFGEQPKEFWLNNIELPTPKASAVKQKKSELFFRSLDLNKWEKIKDKVIKKFALSNKSFNKVRFPNTHIVLFLYNEKFALIITKMQNGEYEITWEDNKRFLRFLNQEKSKKNEVEAGEKQWGPWWGGADDPLSDKPDVIGSVGNNSGAGGGMGGGGCGLTVQCYVPASDWPH